MASVVLCFGVARWLRSKESACQCRRHRFKPWVRKIPWRRKWQSTAVSLPGKSHGQRSLVGRSLWGTERVGLDLAAKQQQYTIWLRCSMRYLLLVIIQNNLITIQNMDLNLNLMHRFISKKLKEQDWPTPGVREFCTVLRDLPALSFHFKFAATRM